VTKPLQERALRHGHFAGGKPSPTYSSWSAMLQRCTNPESESYADYGGRGITVCERWLRFENFLADVGNRPDGTTLDRIDNDRGYEPDNVRWATRAVQNANQRRNRRMLSVDDERGLIDAIARGENYRDLAQRYDINRNTITEVWKRHHGGSTPRRNRRRNAVGR
jgi:hypothetical protein